MVGEPAGRPRPNVTIPAFHLQRGDSGREFRPGDRVVVSGGNDYSRQLAALTHRYPVSGRDVGINELAGLHLRQLKELGGCGAEAEDRSRALLGLLLKSFEDQLRSTRELVFERVRRARFPGRPSRENCLWLIPDDVECLRTWIARMRMRTGLVHVVRCEGSVHTADARLVRMRCQSLLEVEELAARYWEGPAVDVPLVDRELITSGPIRILESFRIEDFPGCESRVLSAKG